MLRHSGKYMDGKPVCLGKIDGFEIDIGVHDVRNKSDIAGEPVQLSNYKRGPVETTGCQCLGKPWPIIFTTAFDLGVFGNQVSLAA
jgi:hypothetical protein